MSLEGFSISRCETPKEYNDCAKVRINRSYLSDPDQQGRNEGAGRKIEN